MKPTQEQVIAWAREAGFRLEQPLDSEGLRPGVYFPNGSLVKLLHVACALAYEAGRKDEREWQGLTDEELFATLVAVDGNTKRLAPGFVAFYCAIEAKLKEKNT